MITAPPGIPQEAVDRAEIAVCLALGLEMLESENRYETGTLKGRIISLKFPASRLGGVTIGEQDVTDYARLLTPYGVQLDTVRQGLDISISPNYSYTYEVTYRTGWDADEIPLAIRQAVILTAQAESASAGMNIPEGVSSIRLPEISVQFAGNAGHQSGGIPAQARGLLKPWLRLKW